MGMASVGGGYTAAPSYIKVVPPVEIYPITLTLEYYNHGRLSDSVNAPGGNTTAGSFHGVNYRYNDAYWLLSPENDSSIWALRDGKLNMSAMSSSSEEKFVYSDQAVRLALLTDIDGVNAGEIAAIFGGTS